ncbi:MAG: FMN-binding protein [Terrimesophilobacter sp.]
MRQKKWRGTVLFVVILAVLGVTVGLRLYGSGLQTAAVALTTSAPQLGSTSPNIPSPNTTAVPQSPQPAPSPAAPPATKSIDGAVVDTPYGPVQVSVTFTASKITGITELQAPNDRDQSVQINNYAAPILKQEVLKSQSSSIDIVSGATYTSEGYAQSVQSAIDKL